MAKLLRAVVLGAAATVAAGAGASEREYVVDAEPGGDLAVSARFVGFNREPLALRFAFPGAAVREAMDEFGYSRADTQRMAETCGCTQEEYDRRVEEYYRGRAVAWRQDAGRRRLYVDIPQVVQRNRPRLQNLAAEFSKLAQDRGYSPEQALGAMLAFVQAALAYERPPNEENGRDILGFYPPPRALQEGSGDCDTKSALLAAILVNFPGIRLIGVHVPKHYLVGIARVPRPGDAFIEYRGEPFVLIEPSGPARLPPGQIGPVTQAALATMNGIRIDPLF
jgi:hypothetical protein